MVIDFRVRPPFGSFRGAMGPVVDPEKSDDMALDAFVEDLLANGVSKAVIMGRYLPSSSNVPARSMENADIITMMERFSTLFVGFGSVDVSNLETAGDEIAYLADQGFSGIAFDNPLAEPPRYDNDENLFPLYRQASERGLIIALTSSALVGHTVGFSFPEHVQAVAQAFPTTPVVVPHACWPWTAQAVGAVLQSLLQMASQLFLIPDVYLHTVAPGRKDYVDALRWQAIADWTGGQSSLASRFLFASSYPVQMTSDALQAFRSLELDRNTEHKVLYENAAGLLGVSED